MASPLVPDPGSSPQSQPLPTSPHPRCWLLDAEAQSPSPGKGYAEGSRCKGTAKAASPEPLGGWKEGRPDSGGRLFPHQPGPPFPLPVASGVMSPLGPFPQHTVFSLWAAPLHLLRHRGPGHGALSQPKLFGSWRPGQLPLAGADGGKQAPPRPSRDRSGGDGWATRAEGSGLPEPRQHTCVSNFLSSLHGACSLPSPAPTQPPCSGP